ncbi:MAG: diacylglycerol kinase family protein, partial [Ferruginibacter sp.]
MQLKSKFQHIAILVNPFSGKGRAIKVNNIITNKLLLQAVSFQSFSTEWPEFLHEFSEVWLIGGDGTINFFLNKYKENSLPLVFFKGGTGNDLAWKLFGDINIDEQLKIALTGKVKKIDAVMCNNQVFVNSSGIGFDGEVLKSIGTIRWLGGHLGYLAIVLRKIFLYNECTFKIQTDYDTFHGKYLLVIVNNSSRTGGGFLVTPEASVKDGLLDMVLCKPLSILKRLRYLPLIEKGKHLKLPFIIYRKITNAVIETDKEVYAQIDGELIKANVFDIKILKMRNHLRHCAATAIRSGGEDADKMYD